MPIDFRRMVDRARARARPELDDGELAALIASAPLPPADLPYARQVLHSDEVGEVMLARWKRDAACAAHDHGGAGGVVLVLAGSVVETPHLWQARRGLVAGAEKTHGPGSMLVVPRTHVHSMRSVGEAVTLHVYGPGPTRMRVHDLAARRSHVLDDGHGAWLPESPADSLAVEAFDDVAARRATPVILVAHTTHYREGSEDFARAASTLVERLRAEHPDAEVRLLPVRYKREFVAALEELADDARNLSQLHFVGHSGMYGIMFGSTEWPEQLSPHEWRALRIPFTDDGRAFFHACRTGRWFAAFFARTFGVPASGHHGYTTVSLSEERFVWKAPFVSKDRPLHVIACVGRKSHGLPGALRKHLGLARAEPMRAFEPVPADEAPSYDGVARLYDEAFEDLRVRAPEVAFVERALADVGAGRGLRVLDLGCGNGALLSTLGKRVADGVGVDVSQAMIERALARHRAHAHLRFERITGPDLPFDDASFDAVVCFLSFRYLDWDPSTREIERILRPGGKLVIVDMVDKPIELREAPLFVRSLALHAQTRVRHRAFVARLASLTRDPAWARMLAYNPIRAEHEYRWYLESRFPGRKLEVLSASRTARVVAFDSGAKDGSWRLAPMSYP